ncbi:MAG TPA: acyltransferase family protein [Conexibacter sp.]|jgi:peptidoglycan/LPS O-acetylase OafA/YrhL
MPSREQTLAYRPGLDGIRALAVAAVVLYHGRVSVTPGGFLGVDIFFVLSGFLITSLLLSEHARTGSIDLIRFWLARVRRLLPAALLVIVVSLLAVAILSSADLPPLRSDALWSALYVNNWHQIFADRSYFSAFGRPSLLQHYWSLALEEQFYLLWPPLLLIGLRYLTRAKAQLLVLLAAVVSFGLMLVLYDPHVDPTRVYYGTDTRALPLLVGVLLAFVWPAMSESHKVRESARLGLDAIGVAGLAIVLFGIVSWNDFDPFVYRGGFLIVALGAGLLIASVSNPASDLSRVFAWAPLVWIGRRSYGIYLWHWPVMAMTRPDLDVRASTWVLVPLQIALTLVLAALSYRYVEMPVRRGDLQARVREWVRRDRKPRRRAIAIAAPAALAAFIGIVIALPAAARHVPLKESASALAQVSPVSSPARAPRTPGPTSRPPATTTTPRPSTTAQPAPSEPTHQSVPPPAHRARATPRGPVLMVGASVMLAAIHELQTRLHASVDAAVSRQPGTILDRLEDYRNAGRLPPVVVVQIGENGPLYYADVQRLKAVLRGVPRVVLMTVRAPTVNWIDDVNAKLVDLAKGWPQARIADWHAASSNPDLTFDGAHPDPAGAKVYESVVARAIRAR